MKNLFYGFLAFMSIVSCTTDESDDISLENNAKSSLINQFRGSCQRGVLNWGNPMAEKLEELINDCSPQSAATYGETLRINSYFYEFGPYTSNGNSVFGLKTGNTSYSIAEQDQIITDAKAAAQGWIQNKIQTDPNYSHLRYRTPHITYKFTSDLYPGIPPGYFFSLEVTYVYEKRIIGFPTPM